jgi:hypothetical protein
MKTKLFYISLVIILFCSCEKNLVCNCGEGLQLWGDPTRFNVVELKNEDLINHIYVVPSRLDGSNSFVNVIPNSLCDNPCPFIHITDNYYLIDCQLPNDNLMSLGAEMINREEFLNSLKP